MRPRARGIRGIRHGYDGRIQYVSEHSAWNACGGCFIDLWTPNSRRPASVGAVRGVTHEATTCQETVALPMVSPSASDASSTPTRGSSVLPILRKRPACAGVRHQAVDGGAEIFEADP